MESLPKQNVRHGKVRVREVHSGKVILSPNFAVKAENWRFLAHAAANLPVFGPETALEGHMNRLFCAYSFVTGLQ